MELNDAVAKTMTQLARFYSSLSPEDVIAIASGVKKIGAIGPSQKLVETSPMVDLALKAAQAVQAGDIERAGAGGSKFQLVHKKGKVVYPVDPIEVAAQASQFDSEDAIVKFLSNDDRLKATDLRKISGELGIDLPSNLRKPEQLIAFIARSLSSFGS